MRNSKKNALFRDFPKEKHFSASKIKAPLGALRVLALTKRDVEKRHFEQKRHLEQ